MLRMYLNDTKVFKQFGRYPEHGKAMRSLGVIQTTAGIRWHQWAGKFKPNPTDVSPTVALKRLKPGCYEVVVNPKYEEAVSLWLMDNCM